MITLLSAMVLSLAFTEIQSKGCKLDYEKIWICTEAELVPETTLQINRANSEVKYIVIWQSVLPVIPSRAFVNYPALESIFLTDSRIEIIGNEAFYGLENLVHLFLHNNNITEINGEMFVPLINLKLLHLQNNHLSLMTSKMFENLTGLTKLNLSCNYIHTLTNNPFEHLHKLENLNLNNNRIRYIGVGNFLNLHSLLILDLSGNLITKLEYGAFSGLYQLSSLFIQNNSITTIPEGVFDVTNNLRELRINNNLITSIDAKKLLSHLPQLYTIDMNENKWTCNSLVDTISILKNHSVTIQYNSTKFTSNVYGIACSDVTLNNEDNSLDVHVDAILGKIQSYFDNDFKNSTFYNTFYKDLQIFSENPDLSNCSKIYNIVIDNYE